MSERPLLMIPGPIEISRPVVAAAARHPVSHVAPSFITTMGRALERMRKVWLARRDDQPFIVPGSGTTVMDMAVHNVVDPGDKVLVIHSGYFSERMAEMMRRRGAVVTLCGGEEFSEGRFALCPLEIVEEKLREGGHGVLAATHVDTSTGLRVDAEALCSLARSHGALSLFDGVCATAAERFEMAAWDADIYLTASQKAIGLPPGLGLMVASQRALARREHLRVAPPLSLDWHAILPIMQAYEEGRPSYFATPATTLVAALDVSLGELLDGEGGIEGVFERQRRCAAAMRRAWEVLGLTHLAGNMEELAFTLSALRYPAGTGPALPGEVAKEGVIVAGGLHPACRDSYFRVGHMGDVLNRPEDLMRTVEAVATALKSLGHVCDPEAARTAAGQVLQGHVRKDAGTCSRDE